MSNIEQLYFNDKALVLKCAQLLNLDVSVHTSTPNSVVLISGEQFDPISNMSDWGIVINEMLLMGFDFALDLDGIIVHGPAGMVTFNDTNIGRRLTKSFVELHCQNRQEVLYASK